MSARSSPSPPGGAVAALLLALLVAHATGSTAGPTRCSRTRRCDCSTDRRTLCARARRPRPRLGADRAGAAGGRCTWPSSYRGLLQQRAHAAESLPPSSLHLRRRICAMPAASRAAPLPGCRRGRHRRGSHGRACCSARTEPAHPRHRRGTGRCVRHSHAARPLGPGRRRTAHARGCRPRPRGAVPAPPRRPPHRGTHPHASRYRPHRRRRSRARRVRCPLVVDPGLPAGKDIFIDLLAAARRGGQRWVAGNGMASSFTIDGVQFTLLYPFARA
jgi:hypothetical protein